jgi:hypothetical protein
MGVQGVGAVKGAYEGTITWMISPIFTSANANARRFQRAFE